MPYLVSDSFGGIGQQALADEQNRRLALASAMGAFQQGMGAMQRSNEFEAAQEAQRHSAAMEHEYRMGELARQEAADWAHNRISSAYLQLGRDQLNWQKTQPTAAKEREREFRIQLALETARSGGIPSREHAAALLPEGTDSAIADSLWDTSEQANDALDQQRRVATGLAETLNRHAELRKQYDALDKIAKAGSWTGIGQGAAQARAAKKTMDQVKPALDDLQEKAGRIKAEMANPKANLPIAIDPESGMYAPTIPPSPRAKRFVAPDLTTATTPAPTAGTAPTSTGNLMYPPEVYGRARTLIGSQGMQPRAAFWQAISEWNAAGAAGNQP